MVKSKQIHMQLIMNLNKEIILKMQKLWYLWVVIDIQIEI